MKFHPGDRVTSPLLVGEWLVRRAKDDGLPPGWVWLVRADEENGDVVQQWAGRLTLVAPSLPPEPPVGAVGFVDGRPYRRERNGHWTSLHPTSFGLVGTTWPGIADRFVPAVPKPTVEEMAEAVLEADDDHLSATQMARIIMRALGWEVPGE